MRSPLRTVLFWVCASSALSGQAQSSIDQTKAKAAFLEAQQLSEREGGHLWGRPLYGPMLFADPETHSVVANQPDANGLLHKEGDVYLGSLPKEIGVANTAFEWAGQRWTMVRWPLPKESEPRARLLAHEMFHRIQPNLGLPMVDAVNPQLDTLDGRYWLQLEWRALAAALVESGAAQTKAIGDAVVFRERRHRLFAASTESERALELNEGLAEYTGLSATAPDVYSARWRIVGRLTTPESQTFVRSFAYISGPAYALLLDERLAGWRSQLTAKADLGLMLRSTVHGADAASGDEQATSYGAKALRLAETERDARADASKAAYRKLLVDGPTLTLPNSGKFSYGFDPNELVPLEGGMVYPKMQASDTWGTLEVKQGALLATDFNTLTVAAPANITGKLLQGSGWTLNLTKGWHLVSAAKAGSYKVERR